ncbi:MAG: alpha/beta hydrolase [Planctomycetales bacterium]|nr:alpha/beta hydrolase [Planctomycetales bacterium]
MLRSTLHVFLVMFALASNCCAQRGSRVDTPQPIPDKSVIYKTVGDKEYSLHVFVPERVTTAAPGPAIVFFFGGGWKSGQPSQFYSLSKFLSERGWCALCAEYRVASRDNSQVKDCVADAQDAILFVREHASDFGVDPNRIAAGGGSAGGHLAASLATLKYMGSRQDIVSTDYRPFALVLFNPAVALAPYEEQADAEYFKDKDFTDRLGAPAESLSPLHNIHDQLPPTIILHGEEDTTVPIWTVRDFCTRAKLQGSKCKVVGFANEKHGFFNFGRPQFEATRDAATEFLQSQISH